jgi:hypothetical protein
MAETCGAQYGRLVGNTDRGLREQPHCSDIAGHPGTHSSESGIAWGAPDAPPWYVSKSGRPNGRKVGR